MVEDQDTGSQEVAEEDGQDEIEVKGEGEDLVEVSLGAVDLAGVHHHQVADEVEQELEGLLLDLHPPVPPSPVPAGGHHEEGGGNVGSLVQEAGVPEGGRSGGRL